MMSRRDPYDYPPRRIGYDREWEDERRPRYPDRIDYIRDYMDEDDDGMYPSRYRRNQREQERISWQRKQDKRQQEADSMTQRNATHQRFDMDKAEEWVECMQSADPRDHGGGRWSAAEVKPFAIQLGIPQGGSKFAEFYAMMNAMYSDYCEVAKKYGVDQTDFYADMAKAWMQDKDAEKDKTALYYQYCVCKEE